MKPPDSCQVRRVPWADYSIIILVREKSRLELVNLTRIALLCPFAEPVGRQSNHLTNSVRIVVRPIRPRLPDALHAARLYLLGQSFVATAVRAFPLHLRFPIQCREMLQQPDPLKRAKPKGPATESLVSSVLLWLPGLLRNVRATECRKKETERRWRSGGSEGRLIQFVISVSVRVSNRA